MIEFLNIQNNEIGVDKNVIIEIYLKTDTVYKLETLQIYINNDPIYYNNNFVLLYANSQINILSSNEIRISLIRNIQYESFSNIKLDIFIEDLNRLDKSTINFQIEDYNKPEIMNFYSTNQENTTIYFEILDLEDNLKEENINIIIENDNNIIPAYLNSHFTQEYINSKIEKLGNKYTFLLIPSFYYKFDSDVKVKVSCIDNNNNYSYSEYTFRIKSFDFLKVLCISPGDNYTGLVDRYSNFIFKLKDDSNIGIKDYTITINNEEVNKDNNNYIYKEYKESDYEIYLYITKVNGFEPSSLLNVKINLKNKRNHEIEYNRIFLIENRRYPEINIIKPIDNSIIPPNEAEIEFDIIYDSEVDFKNISVYIDGYQTYFNDCYLSAETVDGYDGYYVGVGEYIKEPIYFNSDFVYNGYRTRITKDSYNVYKFIINPINSFINNKSYTLKINVKDIEGKTNSREITFYTDYNYYIYTYSTYKTGIYNSYIKNLELVTNNNNYLTYYTIDGSEPSIDNNLNVKGTTKLYTSPIDIYNEGLTILKYFSVDPITKTREKTKTERLYIDIKEKESLFYKKILSDIIIPSKIIVLDNIENLEVGDIIKIVDDGGSSFIRTIYYINNINNPNYIIIDKEVYNIFANKSKLYKLNKDNNCYHIDAFTNMVIGNNKDLDRPSNCVIENLRVLNKASSDHDIYIDYIINIKHKKYYPNKNIKRSDFYDISNDEFRRLTLLDEVTLYLNFNEGIVNIKNEGIDIDKIIVSDNLDNIIIVKVGIKEDEMDKLHTIEQILKKYIPINYNIKIIPNIKGE